MFLGLFAGERDQVVVETRLFPEPVLITLTGPDALIKRIAALVAGGGISFLWDGQTIVVEAVAATTASTVTVDVTIPNLDDTINDIIGDAKGDLGAATNEVFSTVNIVIIAVVLGAIIIFLIALAVWRVKQHSNSGHYEVRVRSGRMLFACMHACMHANLPPRGQGLEEIQPPC